LTESTKKLEQRAIKYFRQFEPRMAEDKKSKALHIPTQEQLTFDDINE